MIKLSIVTNSISSVAQSAAVHIKNFCINNKVDAVFRVTVSTAQTHPYITVGLGLALGVVAVYCYRGQIEGGINKVHNAAKCLYQNLKNSITTVTNIFTRNSTPLEAKVSETHTNSSNEDTKLENSYSTSTSKESTLSSTANAT